ncbi:hypothetical protein [Saccharopolyspora spinosa]|uniref:Uncharacterized protein n=1 Tax=Saccharopolyspora spinosa TaxID=60894 RepID=A0A2N3Y901_SACSN|nr:hypothetical protein [Saccharopolyspora spinosa]PKW19392.1 hypothetical protein A8926_7559 [Saccharopolyspora spinosa]
MVRCGSRGRTTGWCWTACWRCWVFALAGGTSLVAVRGAGPLLWYGILGVSAGLTACLVFRRVRPTEVFVAGGRSPSRWPP